MTLKVSIIGLGYIGLPTAAIIASKGINVNGVDINKEVVDIINSGKIHIVEKGLESVISDVIEDSKGNIWISFDLKGLVKWKNGQVIRQLPL